MLEHGFWLDSVFVGAHAISFSFVCMETFNLEPVFKDLDLDFASVSQWIYFIFISVAEGSETLETSVGARVGKEEEATLAATLKCSSNLEWAAGKRFLSLWVENQSA